MSQAVQKRFEPGVEGLRGLAALCVLYTHLLNGFDLDPFYSVGQWWKILEVSQGAVLLFFVLSGYVIGMSKKSDLTTIVMTSAYVKQRIIRIVPLCWLAIAMSVLVRSTNDWQVVLGNLLFVQNDLALGFLSVPVIASNTNLWSLNYEMLYYGLFILVWLRLRWAWIWFVLALFTSIFAWYFPAPWNRLASTYATGYLFWLAGLLLSRIASPHSHQQEQPSPWISFVLFWLITWQVKPLWHLFQRLGLFSPDYDTWIHFSYIDFILPCLVLILAASGRRIVWQRTLEFTVAALPSLYVGYSIVKGNIGDTVQWSHIVFTILGISLLRVRLIAVPYFAKFAYVGSISYGIYVFQRPIQWALRDSLLPSGNWFSFVSRLVLALVATFAVAHVGERIIQPWIRDFFTRFKSRKVCE